MNRMEYEEYLKSEEWLIRSKKCKDNADNRCQLCNSRYKPNAHHRSYLWVGTEKEIEDLICLCEPCHLNFHGKRNITVLLSPSKPPKGIQRYYSHTKRKHKISAKQKEMEWERDH